MHDITDLYNVDELEVDSWARAITIAKHAWRYQNFYDLLDSIDPTSFIAEIPTTVELFAKQLPKNKSDTTGSANVVEAVGWFVRAVERIKI